MKELSEEEIQICKLLIYLKDERKIELKVQKVTIKNDKQLECIDVERENLFVFNLNEIIYYTLKKAGDK